MGKRVAQGTMPTSPTGSRGFTLVELLIAVVLSSFVVLGISSAFYTMIEARTVIEHHADVMQNVRQASLDLTTSLWSVRRLPEDQFQPSAWTTTLMRFHTRNAAGETGRVTYEFTGQSLWKTWTPITLAKHPVQAGRQGMIVHLDHVEGVQRPAGQIRYAVAEHLDVVSFSYTYADDGGDGASVSVGGKDDWPMAVEIHMRTIAEQGASPVDITWTCPLLQEGPWTLHTVSQRKGTEGSAAPF